MFTLYKYKLLISSRDKKKKKRTAKNKIKKKDAEQKYTQVKKGRRAVMRGFAIPKPTIPPLPKKKKQKNVLEAFLSRLSKEGRKRSEAEVVVEFRGKIRRQEVRVDGRASTIFFA